MRPLESGNQHRRQHGGAACKYKAVDGDDNRRALQVLQLRMLNLAVDLRQALLAAHGQQRMAEGHQNAEESINRKSRSLQESLRVVAEMQVGRDGKRRQVRTFDKQGIAAPEKQNHHHDGGDLHNPQRLVARLLNALDVLPPVVDGHRRGKHCRRVVQVKLESMPGDILQGRWQPVVLVHHVQHLVHQAGDVLPGRHTRDWSRQNVVEHQRRNAQLGEGAAQRFFHHAINAAAGEHRTALDVNRAHREAEQHDAQNEPGRSRTYCLLSDAARVKRRRTKVVEYDGSRAPEGDEREHHAGCHDQPDAVGGRGYGRSRRCHCEIGATSVSLPEFRMGYCRTPSLSVVLNETGVNENA